MGQKIKNSPAKIILNKSFLDVLVLLVQKYEGISFTTSLS